MAARKRRRARVAKRRPAARPQQPAPARSERTERSDAASAVRLERPQAPWHPWPLSELLIVVGAGAILFALANGPERSVAALLAGLGAVAIGTLEVTLREHLAGYRSHALLLALVVVAAMHTALALLLSSLFSFPRAANVVLLALDVAVAFLLYRLLRARYVEARRRAILARR
jgi:hypothetical protein